MLLALFSTDLSNGFFTFITGGANIVFSIINGLAIGGVTKRKKSVLQGLYILAGLGAAFGMFQLLISSAYLQLCSIPLCILLGILAYLNRDVFVN